jgi:ribosomal protein S18 acetylase RimI-like enzyme
VVIKYNPPTPIKEEHDIQNFDCGDPSLNDWLKKRALKNDLTGASRTYVVTYGSDVVGYYTLAAGCIYHNEASGKIKRNMPNPIPAMVLGRLAVDINHQGRAIGTGLLQDAVKRTWQASFILGIRVILVHALNEKAKLFYEKYGFRASPINDLTLMVTLQEVKALFDSL